MKEYCHIVDVLSKKTGGPYRFSSLLMKRVRQLVKGTLRSPGSEPADPVRTAFEEFVQGRIQAIEGGALSEITVTREKKSKEEDE